MERDEERLMAISKLQADYASWLLTTKRDREMYDLPTSSLQFARLKGVADRTLRRWRNDVPEFQEYLEDLRRRANREGVPVGLTPPEEIARPQTPTDARTLPPAEQRVRLPPKEANPAYDDALSLDEQQYATVKAEIARQASGGDAKALELYLKYWGGEHLRRERAENELLAGMTDGQLVSEVISMLGVELVASALADL